jgi:hypothetical protein
MGGGAANLDLYLRERLHENNGNEYKKSPPLSTQPYQKPLYQGEPRPAVFVDIIFFLFHLNHRPTIVRHFRQHKFKIFNTILHSSTKFLFLIQQQQQQQLQK